MNQCCLDPVPREKQHDDNYSNRNSRINELVRYFLRLGCLGFSGQVERELVDERKSLTKEQMREAIAIYRSLHGLNGIGAIPTH